MKTIKEWFTMKRKEIECKLMLYSFVVDIMDNKVELVASIKNVFMVLKDVPADQLYQDFLVEITRLVYDREQKDRKMNEPNTNGNDADHL